MKTKHHTLFAYVVVLALVSVSTLFSQYAGKIAGKVRDRASKEGLPGVNITINGTKLGGSTGTDGSYFILNVSPGSYSVTASLIGYQKVTQQKVIVSVDRTTTLDFALRESAVEAEGLVVTAEMPDVVREKTSTSEIIRADEVVTTANIRDLNDLLTLSSDISEGHFRGGREGEELYNLSGMGIVNPLSGSVAFSPIISAMEQVEVITSGFGAQYGNAQSGVVNVSMKEGGSDRWRARAEMRTRAPAYKHFGPSIYDPAAQPYLQLLDTPEKWRGALEGDSTGSRYYSTIGNGFDGRYGRDSITLSQIAYSLWALQGRRDVNRKYNNLWDYSTDVTLGGPLSDNTRLFLAAHLEDRWLYLPTPDPDRNQQVLGNIVFDVGAGKSLRISGAYSQQWTNILRSRYTNGFFNWLWDRVWGVSQERDNTFQLGFRFTHAVSEATFYEIKFNRLQTDNVNGSPVMDPDGIGETNGTPNNASKLMWYPYGSTPDRFYVGNRDDNFGSEKTVTNSLDASFNSQVTSSHLLHCGIQGNLYSIDVANRTSVISTERLESYSARPFELALYAQDKMEFEGMIANMGLRFDLWNINTEYYTDLYSPFRVGPGEYDPANASKAETPTIGRLQPRIGISFPVWTATVFHMNYGSFVQRPPFSRTIAMQIPVSGSGRTILGNPRLLPETTNSYDLGIMQGFGDGFTLDVSAYYKDVKNLIQQATFTDNAGAQYYTYVNREYADIRGFHIVVTKRRGFLTGSVNYTYMRATGKSSTPFDETLGFSENPAIYPEEIPGPKDITLDFDRTHNLVATIGINTPNDWGPALLGGYPLDQVTLSVTSTVRSGRPWSTRDQLGTLVVNNARTPTEYNTNLRLTKRFDHFFGAGGTLFAEVVNLFNQKIYSYTTVFQRSVSTSGSTYVNPNPNKYETDPASLQYEDSASPFLIDQTFLLYSNSPRSFYLGFTLTL